MGDELPGWVAVVVLVLLALHATPNLIEAAMAAGRGLRRFAGMARRSCGGGKMGA